MSKWMDAVGNTLSSWQLGIGGARLRSNAGTVEARTADNSTLAPFLASQIKSPSISDLGTRQTVLNGAVDANGFPNALSAGSGLSVTLTASATPFLLAFAAGFDAYGAVDYVAQVTANQTISGLTASATLYLYADRNTSTGAVTFGFTTFGTTYSLKAPSSPSTNQPWFDLSAFQFKVWNGSAWAVAQRVILGEVTTGSSSVTSTTTYAYQGLYQSLWTSVAASTNYVFSHNLGIPLSAATPTFWVYTSPTGSDADSIPDLSYVSLTMTDYGWQPMYPATIAPWKTITIATKANPVLGTNNSWSTSGYLKLTIKRGW